ncbi:MAG: L-seryl-tRNA(Sec) selenium transferase [Deltaproteobacteria bacterium]|nr:L-seryl-tRNA(Sec) selenium transferase [Deltaproteobacteria bacterium]
MSHDDLQRRLRALPAVDALKARPAVQALEAEHGAALLLSVLRECVERARQRLRESDAPAEAVIDAECGDAAIEAALGRALAPTLPPLHNATGVLLHTNLGRAPLALEAREAMLAAAAFVPLEIDLGSGRRGPRAPGVVAHLKALSGAEGALVVNNCAAAVMLVLAELAQGREVPVSRGELVEIGGGFRVPEVMERSGCQLREVGTTNRTRLRDHAAAVGPRTGALLKVHRSNFSIEGFTEEASLEELAGLARETGLPLVVDLGSGLFSTAAQGTVLESEATVDGCIAGGADLVCFSGDKLLGGPQAGIVVGKGALIERLGRHPLMRSLRCDKVTLAALEATLALYRRGAHARVPLQRMVRATVPDLAALGAFLLEPLCAAGLDASLEPCTDRVGGGSSHRLALPGMAVRLRVPTPERVSARLRRGEGGHPGVVAVVREDALWLHLRTLEPELPVLEAVAAAVIAAAR